MKLFLIDLKEQITDFITEGTYTKATSNEKSINRIQSSQVSEQKTVEIGRAHV